MEGGGGGGGGGEPLMWKVQREVAAFGVSVQEGLQYIKASLLGLVKKAKAKNEQEAAEADVQAAKMQVEAAEEAEKKKQQLGK